MLDNYKDILSVKDVKDITGYTSNNTIYKMINEGNIKYFRNHSGKYLIFKDSLIEYLENGCYNDHHKPIELPYVN